MVEEVTGPDDLAGHGADRRPPQPFRLFRLRLTPVVLTDLEGGGLRVRALRPGAGLSTAHRS